MNRERRFDTGPESAWPWRLSVATLAAAVPLVFFGGSVTTLHAGLAIDGWLVLEPGRGDHFLWLYPIDKWFRDLGTFVEHTHRLFGSLVGLLAIATVVATFDVVVESSKVGIRKPDPAIYQLVCEKLDVRPEEAVFLDDLGINLKPARAMGIQTVKVTDPAQALADLEAVVGFPLT